MKGELIKVISQLSFKYPKLKLLKPYTNQNNIIIRSMDDLKSLIWTLMLKQNIVYYNLMSCIC